MRTREPGNVSGWLGTVRRWRRLAGVVLGAGAMAGIGLLVAACRPAAGPAAAPPEAGPPATQPRAAGAPPPAAGTQPLAATGLAATGPAATPAKDGGVARPKPPRRGPPKKSTVIYE